MGDPLDHICNFVEVLIHNILYQRDVYPVGMFQHSRVYDSLNFESRHSAVSDYISHAVLGVREVLKTGDFAVIVAVKEDESHASPLATPNIYEKFVLEINHIHSSIDYLNKDQKKLLDLHFQRALMQLKTICTSELKDHPKPDDSTVFYSSSSSSSSSKTASSSSSSATSALSSYSIQGCTWQLFLQPLPLPPFIPTSRSRYFRSLYKQDNGTGTSNNNTGTRVGGNPTVNPRNSLNDGCQTHNSGKQGSNNSGGSTFNDAKNDNGNKSCPNSHNNNVIRSSSSSHHNHSAENPFFTAHQHDSSLSVREQTSDHTISLALQQRCWAEVDLLDYQNEDSAEEEEEGTKSVQKNHERGHRRSEGNNENGKEKKSDHAKHHNNGGRNNNNDKYSHHHDNVNGHHKHDTYDDSDRDALNIDHPSFLQEPTAKYVLHPIYGYGAELEMLPGIVMSLYVLERKNKRRLDTATKERRERKREKRHRERERAERQDREKRERREEERLATDKETRKGGKESGQGREQLQSDYGGHTKSSNGDHIKQRHTHHLSTSSSNTGANIAQSPVSMPVMMEIDCSPLSDAKGKGKEKEKENINL